MPSVGARLHRLAEPRLPAGRPLGRVSSASVAALWRHGFSRAEFLTMCRWTRAHAVLATQAERARMRVRHRTFQRGRLHG